MKRVNWYKTDITPDLKNLRLITKIKITSPLEFWEEFFYRVTDGKLYMLRVNEVNEWYEGDV
jgi:hypothetical protein